MQELPHPSREQIRIEGVLEALANPLRLRVVQRLAEFGELTCATALPDVTPSTASRHWRVLRESGVLHARREGRRVLMSLRRDDLDVRFPGLLDCVLAAGRESGAVRSQRVLVPGADG
ncbi:ArsR/SmtB family transcription factor [Kineococcus sp. NUM-3379]